jgi:hypothetical protein
MFYPSVGTKKCIKYDTEEEIEAITPWLNEIYTYFKGEAKVVAMKVLEKKKNSTK